MKIKVLQLLLLLFLSALTSSYHLARPGRIQYHIKEQDGRYRYGYYYNTGIDHPYTRFYQTCPTDPSSLDVGECCKIPNTSRTRRRFGTFCRIEEDSFLVDILENCLELDISWGFKCCHVTVQDVVLKECAFHVTE